MIALCTQWPAQDLALLRAELERAGVQVRVFEGTCDPVLQGAENVVLLHSKMQALRCDGSSSCTPLWQVSAETYVERREATSHLLEATRTRAGDWRTHAPQPQEARPEESPAEPARPLPLPAPEPWSYQVGLRASIALAPLGAMPGLDARAYYTVHSHWKLGVAASALMSLTDRDTGGTKVAMTHVPLLVGLEWRTRPWLRLGGWAGMSLLHASGAETTDTRARAGWAAAPRAELSADLVLARWSALMATAGLRGGTWLGDVQLVTAGAGQALVRGGDLSLTFGVASRGW